jgi:hypothetical protein
VYVRVCVCVCVWVGGWVGGYVIVLASTAARCLDAGKHHIALRSFTRYAS